MTKKQAEQIVREARRLGWPVIVDRRLAHGSWAVDLSDGTHFDGTPGVNIVIESPDQWAETKARRPARLG